MGKMICYCYEFTAEDIKADFLENGRSLILEQIKAEKKQGSCECATQNPSGK